MEISYFETLAKARKAYDRLLQPVCQKWQLSRNALDTLLFLLNNPELPRAADIVRHRGMAKSHVSQAVTELEARQLLLKRTDERDRRNALLLLTPEGQHIAQEGRSIQEQFFGALFSGMSREDFDHWRKTMNLVAMNIDRI